MLYVMIFALGLVIGSFLNVCIYRIPRGESVMYPPSHCPSCGAKLKAVDLVPILSYILLRGRCRYCRAPITTRYPMIELLTGIIYLWTFSHFDFSIIAVKFIILFSGLIIVFFVDCDWQVIPDKVLITLMTAGIILSIFLRENLLNNFLGFMIGGGFLFFIWLVVPEAMGLGDVKFMATAGWFLGLKLTVLSLFLGFILGAVIGIALVLSKKKGMKDAVPFSPFLATGVFISSLYGEQLISFYLRFASF